MNKNIQLNPQKHQIYFSDSLCGSLNVCGALCCKKWDINLALEEFKEGLYDAEVFCALDKKICLKTKKACPQKVYRLKKTKEGNCIYLDRANRCTIYARRPIVCRNFICDKGFTIEPIASVSHFCESDAEICSFEGGLDLKTKFLFNPYLSLRKFEKKKNSLKIIFKNLTSCKEAVVTMRGLSCFKDKKGVDCFLKLFNGTNTLTRALKMKSPAIEKHDFLNATLYLIDEKVLIGVL